MKKIIKKPTSESRGTVGGNITKTKLKGTPFSSAEELKNAQSLILVEAWKKLERARVKRELTKRDEFKFYIDTFRKGISCKYVDNINNIAGISLDDDDVIKIAISEQVMPRKSSDQELLGVLIEAMASAFLHNYLKAMDILEDVESIDKRIAGPYASAKLSKVNSEEKVER